MSKDGGHQPCDLLELSLELTVYGVLLSVIMSLASKRLTAADVSVVCCFLAAVFVFRMLSPSRLLLRYFLGRMLAITLVLAFAWSLLYQAENTRSGWYRFHVLQGRVQQLVSRSPAYVITADADGFITGCSDNIRMLIGWEKNEIVGKHIHVLMREETRARHDAAYGKAVEILAEDDSSSPNAGWSLQGMVAMGIKRKDGGIVPVHVYAGGIRWSQDIQFAGDIDLFAVFVPLSEDRARSVPTTIPANVPLEAAPPPPITSTLSPSDHVSGVPVDQGSPPLMAVPGTRGSIPPPRIP